MKWTLDHQRLGDHKVLLDQYFHLKILLGQTFRTFLVTFGKKHTIWVIRWFESITVILVQLEKDFNNHTKMTVIKIHQSQTIMICTWIGTIENFNLYQKYLETLSFLSYSLLAGHQQLCEGWYFWKKGRSVLKLSRTLHQCENTKISFLSNLRSSFGLFL